ncbi:hypothetical protein G5714_020357 [Onychostoma macrolepis]|uniref:Uncharacterized protein n=1 Tax=Onychostoma macrolepis TaxID=369639 RepID=A0A7J6BTJ4_9TELE|nr:hypothetical protein G5714_020357 [Onychostoma macrolepis]
MESWETAVTYPTSLFNTVQVKSTEQDTNLTGTMLLFEIMSVIARGNCGMQHSLSSWPKEESNSAVERWNRVLKDCIQVAEMQQHSWKQAVPDFLQNCDTTRNHRSVTI